jgi:Sulfotransferase domain
MTTVVSPRERVLARAHEPAALVHRAGNMMKQTLDFIVIGAQKAGTTSLFEYLRRHPELSLPSSKEMPFFSHDAVRSRGWNDYICKTFPSANPQAKWGTVTPSYMVGGVYQDVAGSAAGGDEHTVPLRIRECAPDVRLIAILRDPVERARSHHRMATMEALEQRSFDEAIGELLQPEALVDSRRRPRESTGYIAWGEYGRILSGYLDVFQKDQLLVLFTQDLSERPELVLRRIYTFLEVDETVLPDNLGTEYRVGGSERRIGWLGTNSVLSPWGFQSALASNTYIRRAWHSLPEQQRRRIDQLFSRAGYQLDLWNRREGPRQEGPRTETLELLKCHFTKDADTLTDLFGLSLPWRTDVSVG